MFLTFVVFAKTRVTMQFRAKNAGHIRGLFQVCATSYWAPCDEDGRAEGHVTIMSQTPFLPLIDW